MNWLLWELGRDGWTRNSIVIQKIKDQISTLQIKPNGTVNDIEDEPYYYGYMSRDESEKVLTIQYSENYSTPYSGAGATGRLSRAKDRVARRGGSVPSTVSMIITVSLIFDLEAFVLSYCVEQGKKSHYRIYTTKAGRNYWMYRYCSAVGAESEWSLISDRPTTEIIDFADGEPTDRPPHEVESADQCEVRTLLLLYIFMAPLTNAQTH